jgi:hypothetical protein
MTGVLDVGRKPKGKAGQGSEPAADHIPPQYNVRLNDDALAKRVHDTARALGLDGANFLRMMIRECLVIYERRVECIAKGEIPQ